MSGTVSPGKESNKSKELAEGLLGAGQDQGGGCVCALSAER